MSNRVIFIAILLITILQVTHTGLISLYGDQIKTNRQQHPRLLVKYYVSWYHQSHVGALIVKN